MNYSILLSIFARSNLAGRDADGLSPWIFSSSQCKPIEFLYPQGLSLLLDNDGIRNCLARTREDCRSWRKNQKSETKGDYCVFSHGSFSNDGRCRFFHVFHSLGECLFVWTELSMVEFATIALGVLGVVLAVPFWRRMRSAGREKEEYNRELHEVLVPAGFEFCPFCGRSLKS